MLGFFFSQWKTQLFFLYKGSELKIHPGLSESSWIIDDFTSSFGTFSIPIFHLFFLQKLGTFPTHHHVMDYSLIRPLQLCLFLQPYWVWNFDWSLIVSHPFWKKASNFSPLTHQSLFVPVCTLCYKMVCSLCIATIPKYLLEIRNLNN